LFQPDPSARFSVREELNIPSSALLIGLMARFHPMKDHDTFFRAAQLLHTRFTNTHFVLAGTGVTAENSELLRLVREYRLQSVVHLLGPRTDIARITASLDIACLSSWSESFPNAICEAMACGVPCAVTDVGDARRIVGDAGKVVPPYNPPALAEAMETLMAMQAGERTALGQRARERVLSQFPLQKTVSSYADLYDESEGHCTAETAPTVAPLRGDVTTTSRP